MRSVRILLVDDEPDFLAPLALRLQSRDFSVATAESGDEALAKTDEADFDVAVVDIFMPGRDGLETLREIKQRRPLTEVILLSGRGTKDIAIEGMKSGAYDFLTKPLEIEELVEKVNDAYARKVEHLARIRRASEAEREEGVAVAEDAILRKAARAAAPAVGAAARQGRLLVLGQQSEFSRDLVDYSLDMAERLSYEVLALNAAGFSKETFRSFPSARDRVCQDFRAVSEEKVVPFREAAVNKGIPFYHVVKFSDPDEAIREIQNEIGKVEFVVSKHPEEVIDSGSEADILVYVPS